MSQGRPEDSGTELDSQAGRGSSGTGCSSSRRVSLCHRACMKGSPGVEDARLIPAEVADQRKAVDGAGGGDGHGVDKAAWLQLQNQTYIQPSITSGNCCLPSSNAFWCARKQPKRGTYVMKDRPLPRVKETTEVEGRKAMEVTCTAGVCSMGGALQWALCWSNTTPAALNQVSVMILM